MDSLPATSTPQVWSKRGLLRSTKSPKQNQPPVEFVTLGGDLINPPPEGRYRARKILRGWMQ